MDTFIFQIFPSRSLDQSVITTVWVGVIVFTFFNLRFGWAYSGIVVPGYLVPILITRPVTAVIILLESVLSYWIAWFFADFLARRGLWCNVFGRDRFFVIILCSVAVRLVFDGQILPELAGYLENEFSTQYDFYNNFQSLGLIINALIANYFWKLGVRKSLFPLAINVFVTYLIVRYLLMEYTNFNIGTLEYMYEGIAVSFAASPKSYIVLVTVALFASKLNLHYGWDFNGILIPSLIALQWYEPSKIVFTFLEMIIVLITASLFLKIPFWQNRTIEKASKVLLFFNISFGYRMLLGYFIEEVVPGAKISDFFAAGYLVATLMAVKIHEKNIIIRLSMVTVITSLAAAIVGNIVGFLFFLLPAPNTKEISPQQILLVKESQQSLQKILEKEQMLVYQNIFHSHKKLSVSQRKTFSSALSHILSFIKTQEKNHLEKASLLLRQIHYRMTLIEKRYLFLQAKSKNTGTFVLDTQSLHDIHLETPSLYLHDFKIRDLAIQTWKMMNFRSLAIVNSSSNYSYHEEFHQLVPDILQIRLAPQLSNELRVKSSIPPNFNFASLKQAIGEYKITWLTEKSFHRNNFLELFITPNACLNALAKNLSQQNIVENSHSLKTWLERQKQKIPQRGSNLYEKAKIGDILFFDKVILVPLLKCIEHFDSVNKKFPPKYFQELLLIQKRLRRFGYSVTWFKGSSQHLVIYEKNTKKRRNWGTYVFRLGSTSSFVIQNPNPLFANCSFEFSVDLFDTMEAKALFLSGVHPQTNEDESSNFTDIKGKVSLFHLFYEATLRETEKPLIVVQTKGLKLRPDMPLSAEILLASSRGSIQNKTLSIFEKNLWSILTHSEISVKLVDASFEMAAYKINHLLQVKYLEQTKNKEFCVLWLSPLIYFMYKQQHDTLQKAQFRALGIQTMETDLFRFLQSLGGKKVSPIPSKLKDQIEKYLDFEDIVLLKKILQDWPNIQFSRIVDKSSSKAFLIISLNSNDFPLVVNLSKSPLQKTNQVMKCHLKKEEVENFTFSNFTWMRLHSK